jgi:Uma2 family endonuclease
VALQRNGLIEPLEYSPVILDVSLWRLSVEQYHQMLETGILNDGDPIELLEGLLVRKMTKKPRHTLVNQTSRDVLARHLPAGWFVNTQEPVTTADSEPEPDISLIRGQRQDYTAHHPFPADVGLVVEVSDRTLQQDRTLKLRLYANARIPTYWIINLLERQLEIYTEPSGTGQQANYSQHVNYAVSDSAPLTLDGREIARVIVSDLGL